MCTSFDNVPSGFLVPISRLAHCRYIFAVLNSFIPLNLPLQPSSPKVSYSRGWWPFFFLFSIYVTIVTHSSHMIILGSTWTKLHPPSFGASSACTVKVSCRLQLLQDGCAGPAAATFVAYWGRNIPAFQRRQRLCIFWVFQVGWMAMQFVEMHRSYRTCTS